MRTMIVAIHMLPNAQRARIAAAARANGITPVFLETPEEALPWVEEAEIIFADAPELARKATRLRWMSTPSAGVNRYSRADFVSPDAVLTNASGAYGVTIAEHIVMVTLMLMRRQLEYGAFVQQHQWKRRLAVRGLYDCRAALLGTGDIGCTAAKRLRAFEPARLTGVNRSGRNPEGLFDKVYTLDALETALAEADLAVLSLPGTAETEHVLNAQTLACLPNGAIVVNVGRGSAIDTPALMAELRAGRLSAALDVFETEPLPEKDPLWDCPNLLITPHVAGDMTLPHTVERIVDMFLTDLEHYCKGEPLEQRVDLERGY